MAMATAMFRPNIEPNPALGHWVHHVRRAKKNGTLAEEIVRRLDVLGFCWAPWKTWEQHIDDLKSFRETHGHCNVPKQYPANPAPGSWVRNVRKARKDGTLAEERVRRLDALGFCWVRQPPIAVVWEERIKDLKTFKNQYGHCNVPTSTN